MFEGVRRRPGSPGQRTGMGFEDLDRIGAGFELARQVLDLHRDQAVDERFHQGGLGIGERAGGSEVGRATSADHVARHRPGTATEPEKRRLGRQFGAQAPDGLEDRLQMLEDARIVGLFQAGEFVPAIDRIETRAFPFDETDILPEGVRHDEDVGEQDRCVEAEPPDRLQGHLGGEVRIVAEVEERTGPGPDLAIFWQVAPGLPHHPGGRDPGRFAVENLKQRTIGAVTSSHARIRQVHLDGERPPLGTEL